MRLAVVGADGRMGREVIKVISELDNVELSAAIVRKDSLYLNRDAGMLVPMADIGLMITSEAEPSFAGSDAVIDFTTPEASLMYAACAQEAKIAFITGTTGLSAEQQRRMTNIAKIIPVVQSGNMSLGVNLLAELLKQAATILAESEFDIEIAEMHHRHKVDAPSGTALLLGQAAALGRGQDLDEVAVIGRCGQTGPRTEGKIGFSSLRGGSVVGDHNVVIAGDGERIVLSHFAQNRSIFAKGAIKAALWAYKKEPALYSMRDVLGYTS